MDLPTAPFMPKPATKATPTHTKASETIAGVTDEALSKSQFKKFIKNMIGRVIPFYVEDFVSTDNNNPNKWNYYGQSFAYQFNHEIVGETNSKMAEEVMEAYNCAEGKVLDATYDKATRLVSLTVEITGVTSYHAVTPTLQ